jgi:NTE family protein
VIIAVNLGTPLGGPEMLTSALGMAQQMLNILTEQNVERSLRELGPDDILITPDLRGVQFMQFDQIGRSIEAGAAAARAVAGRLARWSTSAAEHAAFGETRRALHRALVVSPPVVASVSVETRGARGDPEAARVVTDAGLRPGDPISAQTVNAAAARLQQRTGAERVDALVTGEGASRDIVLLPIASPLGLSRFRLGLELEGDSGSRSDYTLSGLYTMSQLNAWGAEWRTLLRVGALRELRTEWYQPLGAGSPWFASLRADTRAFDATIYSSFVAMYEAGISSTSASVALGRRLFDGGQIRLGAQRRYLRLTSVIPDDNYLAKDGVNSLFADFYADTLDSVAFPTRGYLLAASYENFGTDRDLQRSSYVLRYDALYGFSRGPWAGHMYTAGLRGSLARALPLSLGGFLRLSGAPSGSVVGEQLAFGRVVAAREVGRVSPAIGGAIRLGMSIETGRGFGEFISATGRTYFAASAFTTVETRFGPLYLGVGRTHNVGTAVYLYLGSVLLPNGLIR